MPPVSSDTDRYSRMAASSFTVSYTHLDVYKRQGEIRRVPQPERRAIEAYRMGFKNIILPAENKPQISSDTADMFDNCFFVNDLTEAIDIFFSL